MRSALEIATRWINQDEEEMPPKSEVLFHGVPTGTYIPGIKLETAVEWRQHYLLFMTYDDDYEDCLNIALLNRDMKCLDRAFMGVPYAGGWLTSLKLLEPDMVQFNFFLDRTWTVQLLHKPRLAIPIIGEMFYVIWRPFSCLRRFRIHLNPEKLKSRWTSVTTVIDINVPTRHKPARNGI